MVTLNRLLLPTKEAVVYLAYSYGRPLEMIDAGTLTYMRLSLLHGCRSRSRVGERKLMGLVEANNFVATTIAQQGDKETYILALHRK